jgi:hypothetical protein
MSASIARYLKDFGDPQPSAMAFADDAASLSPLDGFDDPFALPEPEPIDLEAEKRASFAEGHEAAVAEMRAQAEAERNELVAAHAAEMETLRLKYTQELAALVAKRLRDGTDELAKSLSEQAATVLAPVLSEELSAQAATSLAALVTSALVDGEATKLIVKGPSDMFERLKEELGLDDAQFQYTETPDIDLSVEIGESVLVTRMSAWASSLRKVLK